MSRPAKWLYIANMWSLGYQTNEQFRLSKLTARTL